ncbi:esterase-like activity of phytase family protein [Streptomyces sp. NPDC004031]
MRALPLCRADGSAFPDSWYDAESLVVEQRAGGPRTMLIGSETGPAIRRFDMDTGRQVGPDLVIPANLHYAPEGGAQQGRSVESLTVSPNGHHLYAGWEAPLARDGDNRGENVLRIQRWTGTPGGTYTPSGQFAYRSGDGLNLADLAAVDDDGHLLALERQYVTGLGNEIQVAALSLAGAGDVTGDTSLYNLPARTYVQRELLFDLADCPAGGRGAVARSESDQRNPLLDNVEGMALGPRWKDGPRKGWRPLLMVSDDNNSANQITRLYALAVRLPGE